MNKIFLLILTVLLWACGSDTEGPSASTDYFSLTRKEYDAQKAYDVVDYVEDYWRLAGNDGFNKSIEKVVENLKDAGYVREEHANSTDRLTYRVEKRPMNRMTWEPIRGTMTIVGADAPFLSFPENFNMMAVNSWSTPAEGVTAEVVKIVDSKYDGLNIRGKIVFAKGSPYRHYKKAIVEGGAIGLLTYSNPEYLQPEKNVTSIQFRSIPQDTINQSWAIALSHEANALIDKRLNESPLSLNVSLETKLYNSEELTVIAKAHGDTKANEEIVFSAHVQEPGANDNASGVGAQTEMARTTAVLLNSGKLELARTITFLFGDEIISTRRYVEEDSVASAIRWGISLDMVGEDTEKTGGSFLIEKMPDPAAVWLRGEDKHTEWGGRQLELDKVIPHYFNDFIIDIFKEQGAYANWTVNSNPYEGGSDHVPFLRGDLPGILLWHFTDQYYHTDNDRIDKVSAETLKNVGIGALVTAYTLSNLDESVATKILSTIQQSALDRLSIEFELSKQELAENNDFNRQAEILNSWTDYYLEASVVLRNDLREETSQDFDALLTDYEKTISNKGKEYLQALEQANQ
jgi:aminopeptidase YwaD